MESKDAPPAASLADDLLWGAAAIARELGVTRGKVFYYLETGTIPSKKIGGIWVGSRAALHEHFRGAAA
jgi:hypothetical protein